MAGIYEIQVRQLKQKELQLVSEKYANKIAKLRKEMYVENWSYKWFNIRR